MKRQKSGVRATPRVRVPPQQEPRAGPRYASEAALAERPPAKVAESFKSVGELQLHRLTRQISFGCVTCRRVQYAARIATAKGSWKLTVCETCYTILVGGRSDRNQPARPIKRHPGKNVPKQSADKFRPAAAPQTRAVERVLGFFWTAGITGEIEYDGCILINGHRADVPARLPPAWTPEWASVIDRLAWEHAYKEFASSLKAHARFGADFQALPLPREKAFAIIRGEITVARIHPTHADIPGHPAIDANFLAAGLHWGSLAEILCAASLPEETESGPTQQLTAPDTATETVPAAATTRRMFRASDLPRDLAGACLEASRRIRQERQLAYRWPVVLECKAGKLTLEPLEGEEASVCLPFSLETHARSVQGRLILANHDPLPLMISTDIADSDAATVWAYALLGFADVTCITFESPPPQKPRRQRRTSAAKHRSRRRSVPRTSSAGHRWPEHLQPLGPDRTGQAFVAGHKRRLPEGQTASEEAVALAAQLKIILYEGETWVRPFIRGGQPGTKIRFRWKPPSQLTNSPGR